MTDKAAVGAESRRQVQVIAGDRYRYEGGRSRAILAMLHAIISDTAWGRCAPLAFGGGGVTDTGSGWIHGRVLGGLGGGGSGRQRGWGAGVCASDDCRCGMGVDVVGGVSGGGGRVMQGRQPNLSVLVSLAIGDSGAAVEAINFIGGGAEDGFWMPVRRK